MRNVLSASGSKAAEPGLWSDRRKAAAGIAVVSLIIVVIVTYFYSLHAFWSSDCAARFAMVTNFVEHGSLIHLAYDGRATDPTGQISPLAFYLEHRQHDFVPQYEPLFPFVSAIFYRIFGFYGLAVVPALCGVGTMVLLYRTAVLMSLKSAFVVPLVAGLGTPILVYSVVFWDHSAMMLCVSAAAYFILQSLLTSSPRAAVSAGAMFGVGMFIHELMIAVFVATVLAGLPIMRSRPCRATLISIIYGFAPFAILWPIVNFLLYGSFMGAHIGANMTASVGDHPFGLAQILDWPAFLDRCREELVGIMSTGVLLTNLHLELLRWFNVLTAICLVITLAAYASPKSLFAIFLLSVAAAGIDCYLVWVCHWANGLLEATPLFVPALAVPWFSIRKANNNGNDPGQRTYIHWMSRAAWVYVALAVINPMLPGVDWGSRYLLPILPFLTLLSSNVLQQVFDSASGSRRYLAVFGIGVVVLSSCYCQAEGVSMIDQNIKYNRNVNHQISKVQDNVVVYSQDGTGPEADALPVKKQQYLVRSEDDWLKFLEIMHNLRCNHFTFVGPNSDFSYFEQYTQSAVPGTYTTSCSKQWNYTPIVSNPYCPPLEFGAFSINPVPDPVLNKSGDSKAAYSR